MTRTLVVMWLAVALVLMAACSPKQVVREVPVTVKVPVVQPCTYTKPGRPITLEAKTPEWQAMDLRQRVAAIGAWALEWVDYAENLEVELAGCPKVVTPSLGE